MREENICILPAEFLVKMKQLLGDEYEAFTHSYKAKRVQGLRFNTWKGALEEGVSLCGSWFGLSAIPWAKEGFYYNPDTRPGKHPFHEAGVYYIQEPSAMAAAVLLDPQPGERILDLCAAPGGKTTQIAARMQGSGLLVSNEIHPQRAKILSQNVERMGIRNAVVTNTDSAKLKSYFPLYFDRIMVDAPCSGEGMFRKDETALTEWSQEAVRTCAGRQQEILGNAADMLKPGGRLVYSTCTFSPEENEDSIEQFLKSHPDFLIEELPGPPGLDAGRPEWAWDGRIELSRTFRIWPHKTRGEGHFLAVLKKQEGEESQKKRYYPTCCKDKKRLKDYYLWKQEVIKEWNDGNLILFGEQLYEIPDEMLSFDGLKVVRPGLHLGTLKKNRFEPSHALALTLRPEDVKQVCSLAADSGEIRRYLAGESLADEGNRKGWVLMCVSGYALGWAKASGGVLKNHYPKGLRCRMEQEVLSG